MKRILCVATLSAAMVLSACGDKIEDVSRAPNAPLIFGFGATHHGATSTRSSVDLLSLN